TRALFESSPDGNWERLAVKASIKALLIYVLLTPVQAEPRDTIGAITFFGHQGLDLAKEREALPVKEGDPFGKQTKELLENAMEKVIGKKPTDVAEVCCNGQGRLLIYIGLAGGTYKPFVLNPAPTGREKLPPEIVSLEGRANEAGAAAVKKGGDAAEE